MNLTEEPNGYRYWGFISYSHSDEAFATRLHRAIESYRVPASLVGKPHPLGTIPRFLKPIFRDRDELPGAADLGSKIRGALQASRYLIVICSPRSAKSAYVNEEIRYFKSLGRSHRVLAVILEGEPHGNSQAKHDECFPVELKTVQSDAANSGSTTPLAADARTGKDESRRAILKTIAGVLEVGFDELFRREKRRQRIIRLQRIGSVVTGMLLIGFAYIALVDANINLPRGNEIRCFLDRYGVTIFRGLYSESAIAHKTVQLRQRLLESLLDRTDAGGLVESPPNVDPGKIDPWSSAQVIAGLAACRELTPAQASPLPNSLERLWTESLVVDEQGQLLGWRFWPRQPPIGAASAWMFEAAIACHSRVDCFDERVRARLTEKVNQIVPITKVYLPSDGNGWNLYPEEANRQRRNCYVSILMLQALVSAREHNVDWASAQQRDELIAKTAEFLLFNYHQRGWRRTNDDHDPGTSDGMAFQGYCALLRAARTGTVVLRREFLDEIAAHVSECTYRSSDFENSAFEFEHLVWENGSQVSYRESVSFLWYPWAVQCAALWLGLPENEGAPREQRVAVQRAFGHLVIELGDSLAADVESSPPHAAGELLYGLSMIE